MRTSLTLARASFLVIPLLLVPWGACQCDEVGDLAPAGSIEPAVFDFGPLVVGTECTANLKVKNVGEVDMSVQDGTLKDTEGDWAITKVPSLVKRGSEEDLLVAYTAGDDVGAVESTNIELQTDDPQNEGILRGALRAIVTDAAAPAIKAEWEGAPEPLDYGAVQINGTGLIKSITIINDGTANMDVSAVLLNDGNAAFTIDSITRGTTVIPDDERPIVVFAGRDAANCGAPLADENTITVNVRYTPDQIGGDVETLVVLSNSVVDATLNIPLQGEGSDTNIILSPAVLNFGALGEGETLDIPMRVSNAGTQDASVNVACIDLEDDDVCDVDAECEAADPGALSGTLTCRVATAAGAVESKGFVLAPTDGVAESGDDERVITVTWSPAAGATQIPSTAVLALHSNILGDKVFKAPLFGGSLSALALSGATGACSGTNCAGLAVSGDVCVEATGDPANHTTWTGSVVVTVENTSDVTVNIAGIELQGSATIIDDYVVTPPANLAVGPGATADFTVSYSEADPACSDEIANINVNYDSPNSPLTIVLNVVPPT